MGLIPSVATGSFFSLTSHTGELAYKMAWAPLRSYKMADERKATLVDLNKDREASAARLEELKAGRHVDDIPLTDDYWKALRKHRQAFS